MGRKEENLYPLYTLEGALELLCLPLTKRLPESLPGAQGLSNNGEATNHAKRLIVSRKGKLTIPAKPPGAQGLALPFSADLPFSVSGVPGLRRAYDFAAVTGKGLAAV